MYWYIIITQVHPLKCNKPLFFMRILFFFLTILKQYAPKKYMSHDAANYNFCENAQFYTVPFVVNGGSGLRKWTCVRKVAGSSLPATRWRWAWYSPPHAAPRALLAHRAAPSSLRCWANASNSAVPPSYHPCTEAFMKYRWSNGFIDHRPRPSSGLSMCHSNSFLPSEDHIISRDPTVESVH